MGEKPAPGPDSRKPGNPLSLFPHGKRVGV
nr:MAG TPA: hypothetical protein [Caudoviricetes sp.]DAH81266.1 MAG TPA: hypothetical protein [Bacteriophage sp.]